MALLDNTLANQAHEPLSEAEVKHALHTGYWGDEAAIKIVLQDALTAESYESSKSWVASWPTASTLYQSPYSARYWEGTQTERANVPFFTVASAVNSLTPQIVNGLFYENPPFMVQERPGTKAQEARAVGAILGYQMDEIGFREELRLGVMNALLYGTNIWKWGWESFTRTRKVYKRKEPAVNLKNPIPGSPNIQLHDADDSIDEEILEEEIEQPTFEHMANLRYVLVDPTLNVPDISKAKFVIHRMYVTFDDLEKMRDRPGFKIPSKEELIELFLPPKEVPEQALGEESAKNPMWDIRADGRGKEGTIDPFQEPLELLERWTGDHYMVVLQKKALICNDDNPFGKIPFLSVGWWDVPEAFFSMGLAKTLGGEQRIQQGITNTWLDGLALNLNLPLIRVKGKSVQTQSVRIAPGKIWEVDNKDDIKPMDRFPGVPEAGEHLSLSQARVDQNSGAGALNSGPGAAHSNMARSATGANFLASSQTTAPDFVEKLANQVIIPFLYNVQEMNNGLLPMSQMRRILDEELQHAYLKDGGDLLNLLNARVKFSILAGSKMQARRNMAQSLPILVQLLTTPQAESQLTIANKRVDFVEISRMIFQTSEWKNYNDVIVTMTPEEMQRAQMNSPAAKMQAQAQMQQQQQEQKKNDQLEIVDAENTARAGREVLRHALEKGSEPDTLTGEPTATVGYGANA